MNVLVLLCLVGAAAASYSSGYTYHGRYPGKCSYDGLYYNDEKSFIICSNGNSFVQACAPGTKNSAYSKFSYGNSYSSRDFCDVNLVDEGYGVAEVASYHEPEPVHAPEPSYAPAPEPSYHPAPEPSYHPAPTYAHVYQGKYEGKCGADGLYYRDYSSFVFCSNGNSYIQPCAPGSKNSGYSKYSYGNSYSGRDFCDVNLVDAGYGVAASYSYSAPEPSYAPEPYHAPEPVYYAPEPTYAPEPYHAPEPVYHAPEPVYHAPEPTYAPSHSYHGRYPGKCEYDGLYYKDSSSFVFCVAGTAYVQPCSPGTKNSGYGKFSYGKSYSARDFCDVNLVDSGYTAPAVYH